jgi:hypothetical protein
VEAFRDLVNARVWGVEESPSKALRLNADSDWEFICVAMDVVGDASYAIRNFLEFSLDGPTKYKNVGERYLRLYGVLSATYLQQEAARKLYALMNCPPPKGVDEQFSQLLVRTLRHQVASHSVDYRDPSTNGMTAHVPVRIGLEGYSCMVTEGRGNTTATIRLDTAVYDHCLAVTSVLDTIYEKSVGTFFRGQDAKKQEFLGKLTDLRAIRDGKLIVLGGGGPGGLEMRIQIVSPTSKDAQSEGGDAA